MNSALRRSPGSPVFEHVFECGMAASCSLTSCLNSPECLAKSDDENEGYLGVGMRGESTGSYSDGNEPRHAQESATEGSKDQLLHVDAMIRKPTCCATWAYFPFTG